MTTAEIKFSAARFTVSAPSIKQCPPDRGREVAFAGRSNAGKSSAINTLTQQKSLARTSKTPGRTQLINYFALSDELSLVDLPGYGFAKVPKAVKQRWDKHLSEYLQKRESLCGLVLLMDIRHPMQDYDKQMLHWAVEANLAVHILLTKADKLANGPAKATLLAVQKALLEFDPNGNYISAQTFSSLKHTGVKELEQVLRRWLLPPVTTATLDASEA